jgi:hypothetical protein
VLYISLKKKIEKKKNCVKHNEKPMCIVVTSSFFLIIKSENFETNLRRSDGCEVYFSYDLSIFNYLTH